MKAKVLVKVRAIDMILILRREVKEKVLREKEKEKEAKARKAKGGKGKSALVLRALGAFEVGRRWALVLSKRNLRCWLGEGRWALPPNK